MMCRKEICALLLITCMMLTLLMSSGLIAEGRQQLKKAVTSVKSIHSNKWIISPDDFFPIGTWVVTWTLDYKPLEGDSPENWKGFKGTTIASDLAAR